MKHSYAHYPPELRSANARKGAEARKRKAIERGEDVAQVFRVMGAKGVESRMLTQSPEDRRRIAAIGARAANASMTPEQKKEYGHRGGSATAARRRARGHQ